MTPTAQAVLRRNAVRVTGPENGPPILFANGFGTDQTVWEKQVSKLARDYRCITFDHAGSGSADPAVFTARRYASLYTYASDLVEICEALELRGARVVGHSVSGMVSMIASVLKPELFSGMLVIGASPRYMNDPPSGYVGGFDEPGVKALFDAMSANYYAWASGFAPVMMGNPERPELSQTFLNTLLSIRPDIAQTVLKVILLSDHRAELSRVRTPVWALAAREDLAVPDAVGDYLASHVKNLRLVRLDAYGHLPHVSAPGVVAEIIGEWLRA